MVKILVVDDNPDLLTTMKTVLDKKDYKLTCVSTGQGAIDAFDAGKFDLIILDIIMPNVSGWDVFSHVAKANPKQKIVFLSANEITPQNRKKLGPYDVAYVSKPYDVDHFLHIVDAILKGAIKLEERFEKKEGLF